MFDEGQSKSFGKAGEKAKSAVKAAPFNWKALPVEVLIQYRDEITRCLPPLSLAEMNLEEELLLQLHSMRTLQHQVLNDDDLPLNQRAAVANSVAASLNKLADLQHDLYSSERFKAIERLLIRSLMKLPEDVAEAFLSDYEKILAT